MSVTIALLAVTLAGVAPRTAFESMKGLAGDWEGPAMMTEGAGAGAGAKGEAPPPARVSYRVVSNGAVLMETLFGGTPHEMITMYHLDGDDLVLTHYCAAGNQPKMKLDTATSTDKELRFAFAGGRNITPEGFHMHDARFVLVDADHVEAEWVGQHAGKPAHTAAFKLTRKK